MQSIEHLLTRDAKLLKRSAAVEDDDGDWTYDVVVTDVPAELQQVGSGESADGGILQSRWRVWLPPYVAATGWDAIQLDDVVFELDGDPAAIWNPLARSVNHVEAEVVTAR